LHIQPAMPTFARYSKKPTKIIMKKILLSAILLISLRSFSQVKTFVFAGIQGNNAKYTINGSKQNTSFKIGGQAGMGMKVPFEGRLSFVPSIFYSMKGYKVKYNQSSPFPDATAINNSTNIHCLELAAMLQHDFSTDADHFFIRFGPSLDFQLFGNEKFQTSSNTTVDREMPFSYGEYGHYSGNAHAHFGYEKSNGFFVYAQYTYGLASINNFDLGPQIRHRDVGISVGFYLKKK
jgi:Outer membrane protein beta-barrel domain